VLRVRTADVLLHGAISFLLHGRNWLLQVLLGQWVNANHVRNSMAPTRAWRVGTHAGAALPAARAIVILQRTHNDVVLVRHGEGGGQGGARWHSKALIPHGRALWRGDAQ
jgi:hypothetical protein